MRLSILSLGVSLLALPAALAQVPAPPAPTPVPYPLIVKPSTPQATLTGVPALPPAPPILPSPPTKPYSGELTWSMSSAPASTKPKTRVFEVADLVHAPLQVPGAAALENTAATTAHTLMKLIVAMAKPDTWERHGGAGKIEFIAASDCLCVTNSPDAVAEVAKVLDGLRRMQDSQVFLEVTLLTAPAGFGAKAGWPTLLDKGKVEPKYFTPDEVKKVVADMKGDPRVRAFSRPSMAMTDGQAGLFQVTQAVAVQRITPSKTEPGVTAVSHETIDLGTTFNCTPALSIDGKSIQLKMETTHTSYSDMTHLPNGVTAKAMNTLKNNTSVALPCGHSAIVYLGKQSVEERIETRVPALSKVPYLDRLFRNTGVKVVEQDVYQIVTVRRLKDVDFAPATTLPVAPCCKPGVELRLNLTAPKAIQVPKQVFSHGSGWFGGQ